MHVWARSTFSGVISGLCLSVSLSAGPAAIAEAKLALDLTGQHYALVEVRGEKDGLIEVYDSSTGKKALRKPEEITLRADQDEAVDGIKQDDMVKFVVERRVGGRAFPQVHASRARFVFKNTLVWVAERDPECRFECRPQVWIIPSRELIKQVPTSKDGNIVRGDEVCLVKKYLTFPQGSCGKVINIFSNGDLQVNTFSLFGIREALGEYDLDLPSEWFTKSQPTQAPETSVERDGP
ncbi:MAG: hypothetical protein IT288_10860 [Bdellovibrionales bacterium]|nr:hypothetical protein [Bdellovibrionales bacterium]